LTAVRFRRLGLIKVRLEGFSTARRSRDANLHTTVIGSFL
jgi:hypothetical protein